MNGSAPVAVVTGAGAGIGRAVSLRLARDGWAIACVDRAGALVEATASLLRDTGGQAVPIVADVTDPAAMDVAVARAGVLGPVSGAVACAGVERTGPAHELAPDIVRELVDVNLLGTIWIATAVARAAIAADRDAAIVLIASVNGRRSFPGQWAYTASKGGVIALATGLAVEWASQRIRVNAIAPGVTDTAMSADSLGDPAKRAALLARVPMGRPARPEEIADAAAFLLSPGASYISGHTLDVDGAWSSLG
ncbi:MAG: SDR family NAD(P)-dependent oxidoreductase [Microbacterium sp.]